MSGVVVDDLDIAKVAASGQCFLMAPREGGFAVTAGRHHVFAEPLDDARCLLHCPRDEFDGFWAHYFDLERDYAAMRSGIDPEDTHLVAAAEFGRGVRILHQDLWEVLCAFLISQNNNIVRITRSMEGLCAELGSVCEAPDGREFRAFPTPEQLASASDLRKLGVGYREPYLLSLAREVVSGTLDLDELAASEDRAWAHERLLALSGVGPKVAACIELFGLHWLDSCPIDTWMRKVLDVRYGGRFDWSRYAGFEGVIQQYLFFYERELAGRA